MTVFSCSGARHGALVLIRPLFSSPVPTGCQRHRLLRPASPGPAAARFHPDPPAAGRGGLLWRLQHRALRPQLLPVCTSCTNTFQSLHTHSHTHTQNNIHLKIPPSLPVEPVHCGFCCFLHFLSQSSTCWYRFCDPALKRLQQAAQTLEQSLKLLAI